MQVRAWATSSVGAPVVDQGNVGLGLWTSYYLDMVGFRDRV